MRFVGFSGSLDFRSRADAVSFKISYGGFNRKARVVGFHDNTIKGAGEPVIVEKDLKTLLSPDFDVAIWAGQSLVSAVIAQAGFNLLEGFLNDGFIETSQLLAMRLELRKCVVVAPLYFLKKVVNERAKLSGFTAAAGKNLGRAYNTLYGVSST